MGARNPFTREVEAHQVEWRKGKTTPALGTQNNVQYPWILPYRNWMEGVWEPIRNPLQEYLEHPNPDDPTEKIQKHKGAHNLKSSWVLCANLYFPFRANPDLLLGFLGERIDREISSIVAVELEFADKRPRDPESLLGEKGVRGANQTSPDVAFKVRLASGELGLVLVESKYTESSFYDCSGFKVLDIAGRARCEGVPNSTARIASVCHMASWQHEQRTNRRYWEHLALNDESKRKLRSCPASRGGYQLLRQQALAEALANEGTYGLVVSCVAYDSRNTALIECLSSVGIEDFRENWGALFNGRAVFKSFTHQEWVAWVRAKDTSRTWQDWLEWVEQRYGYAAVQVRV